MQEVLYSVTLNEELHPLLMLLPASRDASTGKLRLHSPRQHQCQEHDRASGGTYVQTSMVGLHWFTWFGCVQPTALKSN